MVLRKAVCREAGAQTTSFAAREGRRENVIPIKPSLHDAVRSQDLDLIKRVAEKTTNFNEADENGRTPLMIAAEVGCNIIANFLMSKGASMHSRDNDGKTPIDIASENGSWGVISLFDHARGWNRMD